MPAFLLAATAIGAYIWSLPSNNSNAQAPSSSGLSSIFAPVFTDTKNNPTLGSAPNSVDLQPPNAYTLFVYGAGALTLYWIYNKAKHA